MKKLAPYMLAAALALPAIGFATAHVGAQAPEHGDCGGGGHHRGGPHGGRHGDPAQHAAHHARMLTAILDLDAHQQTEVLRILNAEATEMQTLMQQPRSDARHQQMTALHERTKQSIDALLNPTQRATMDRMEAARRADRPARPSGAAPTGR